MAEIVNLRRARKQKDRETRAEEAAVRRRQFGRTKAEKQADATTRDREARHINGHRREPK